MATTPKTADVVFVFPPAYGNQGSFKSHLGVAYLRASLLREPFRTVQYIDPTPGTVEEVARQILKWRPAIVGFTVYDANYLLCLSLARSLKLKRPDLKIVFGGPASSFCSRHILESQPVVDACVLGEAEETGARIFTGLLNGSSAPGDCPGLCVQGNAGVVSTGMPPLTGGSGSLPAQAALDSVPSPYLTGVLEDGRAGVLTGRGCTHHCQYCCFAALGRKTLRLHSIERVVAELEYIAAQQRRDDEHYLVPIHDDAFTLAPTRAKALCQAIADRNLGLALSGITRADTVDEELIRMMKEAGFISLAFGLESAVPSVLRAIGKVRPPDWPDPDLGPEREFIECVRKGVEAAHKNGLHVGVSIILGLPTEKSEDGAATLRFVRSLPIDFYMHNFLWVFPGTPLWATHERYGIGCAINPNGLAVTTSYPYDPASLRPLPKCALENDARFARQLATDALCGCAASAGSERGVSLVVLHGNGLSRETADWLSTIMSVGGTLVQAYPQFNSRDEPTQLDYDRDQLGESRVPVRHQIQLVDAKVRPNRLWRVAASGIDLYRMHRPGLVSIRETDGPQPFLDWLKGVSNPCVLCDAANSLSEPDELVRFLDETGDEEVGSRMKHMTVPPNLKYPGRWLEGTTPCLSLNRIEIDSTGCVRTCRHGDVIGKVGDTRVALRASLAEKAREGRQRRGCADCPNVHCPRCPFPGVDESEYCDMMRTQTRVLDLLKRVYLHARLPLILALQRDRFGEE